MRFNHTSHGYCSSLMLDNSPPHEEDHTLCQQRRGDLDPHLTHGSTGPKTPRPIRHLDPFIRFCSAHRPTDHATPSVAKGRIARAVPRGRTTFRLQLPYTIDKPTSSNRSDDTTRQSFLSLANSYDVLWLNWACTRDPLATAV